MTTTVATRASVGPEVVVKDRTVYLVAFAMAAWTAGNTSAEAAASSSQILFRVVPTILACIVLVAKGGPRVIRRVFAWPVLPFAAAVIVSGAAWLWFSRSQFALWKSIEFALPVIWFAYLLSRGTAVSVYALRTICKLAAAACVVTLTVALLAPSEVVSWSALPGIPQVSSLYPIAGPGGVGMWACIALLGFANPSRLRIVSKHRLLLQQGALGAAGITLVLTQSRGMVVAMIFTVGVIAHRRSAENSAKFLLVLVVAVAAIAIRPELLTRGDAERFATLSNRTLRWKEAVGLIKDRPLGGNGIGVAGRFADINVSGRGGVQGFGQSHSAYLEMALSVGVPLAILIVIVLVVAVLRHHRDLGGDGPRSLAVSILLLALVAGLTNTFVLTFTTALMAMLTALAVLQTTPVKASASTTDTPDE